MQYDTWLYTFLQNFQYYFETSFVVCYCDNSNELRGLLTADGGRVDRQRLWSKSTNYSARRNAVVTAVKIPLILRLNC